MDGAYVWSGAGERGRQRPLGRGSSRRIFDLLARVLCTSVFSESAASYTSAAIDTRVRCEAGAGASGKRLGYVQGWFFEVPPILLSNPSPPRNLQSL